MNRLQRFLIERRMPGIGLACAVALAAGLIEAGGRSALGLAWPAGVVALLVGMTLAPIAARDLMLPGLAWCVRPLLQGSIALLGLRLALSDLAALGTGTVLLVVAAMATTLAAALLLARRLGLGDGMGALAGAATAVCGASATLATASVLPERLRRPAEIAFMVMAANAASTLALLAYPVLARLLGLDGTQTGILLGATIHDLAQVVAAGYGVSEPVGNSATLVKLMRIALLLPVVLALGGWCARREAGARGGAARVPMPWFALGFLGLMLVNSVAAALPAELATAYASVRDALIAASSAGLLVAMAALGLSTSLHGLLGLGARPVLLVLLTSLVLLGFVTAALLLAA